MALIDLDKEIVDFLHANEALTGESPSVFIRRCLKRPERPAVQKGEVREARTDLAVFLRILHEIHAAMPSEFPAVKEVRGRTRIYFSQDPAVIEASGRSTFPVEIPESGWWVTSNTSTDHKRRILEDVLRAVRCPNADRNRWLGEFCGTEQSTRESPNEPEDDDPFKI